jgi:hypothetical protein
VSRLRLEELEERAVPSTSPFFLGSMNQLYAATDGTGKQFMATGGFGVQLSVGELNSSGGGGQFAAFRDGMNRVWLFNGNDNTFTNTGAFAMDIAAGRGEVFLRDGMNRVYVLMLSGMNSNGTFMVTPQMTAAFAMQMSVGFDTTQMQDFLAYRAGDNSVNYVERMGGMPVYGSSGAFAIDIAAGNQKETFIRDGMNRLAILTINMATTSGITSLAPIMTPAFAIDLSVGKDTAAQNDMLVYRAGDNSVILLNYTPGAPPTISAITIPGAFASQVVAGDGKIFIRDGMNQVHYFTIDSTGTQTNETTTMAFATQLVDTAFAMGSVDQIAILDGMGRLFVSQNTTNGSAIASFADSGFVAMSVQGFPRTP